MKTFSTLLIPLLMIMTLTAGCATTAKYDARIRSWEGKNAEVLVKTWGKPDTTEKQSSGNKIYLYTRLKHPAYAFADASHRTIASDPLSDKTNEKPMETAGNQKMYVKCATYFEVTPQNVVSATYFRGDECTSRD